MQWSYASVELNPYINFYMNIKEKRNVWSLSGVEHPN